MNPETGVKTDELLRQISRRNEELLKPPEVELPADLPQIPSMLNDNEKPYLYWLTSQCYSGQGAIVELGSWLGASTAHLAAGLYDSGLEGKIDTFDSYTWQKAFERKAGYAMENGADFQPRLYQNLGALASLVSSTRTDIRKIKWRGDRVEILFLDAPKRYPVIRSVLKTFGPYLMPGTSLIVCQDFCNFPNYPLSFVFSALGKRLKKRHALLDASLVAFSVEDSLTFSDDELEELDPASWSAEKGTAIWTEMMNQLPEHCCAQLEPSLPFFLYDIGEKEKACRVAAEQERTWKGPSRYEPYLLSNLFDRYPEIFHAVGVRRSPRIVYEAAKNPDISKYWDSRLKKKLASIIQALTK